MSVSSAASKLQTEYRAVRIGFTFWGVRKSLSDEQKSDAAETFNAKGQFLSASKKLIDTKHPAWRRLTKLRSQIRGYWTGVSLPYPEDGTRLIAEGNIEAFVEKMATFKAEMLDAANELQQAFDEMREAAKASLGSLFDANDYPTAIAGSFDVTYDFPNVEAPPYLMKLSPSLYEAEKQRVRAKFQEAVMLAEQAFITELGELVKHMVDRLTGEGKGGKPKVFKDSVIGNLKEFFGKFGEMNLGSNAELTEMVEQCKALVDGVTPDALRPEDGELSVSQQVLRDCLAKNFGEVSKQLEGMMVDKPKRKIVRKGKDDSGDKPVSSPMPVVDMPVGAGEFASV